MAKSKYHKIIEKHCQDNGVTIPTGFYRHSAGHLAIIKISDCHRQLVAATWTKKLDVINYLSNYADSNVQILDFKNGDELIWTGGKNLEIKI